ncbi:MAG: LytTR family DNA-binding domain-containing protein [Syntrophomonadaceae bacterium]|nr:LytTR family DNA-binding domain-containing protein [Syntrophomonadaceae bacterium]
MLKVVVLEDEEYNREFIKQLLDEIPVVGEVWTTASGEEAIMMVKKHKPQLVLLDIELSGDELNGLQAARNIYSFDKEVCIVFVTGYAKYAIDSFEVHPYNYILKPIKVSKFREMVEEVAGRINSENRGLDDMLIIKNKSGMYHLYKERIMFIEIHNNLALIHSTDGIFESHLTLAEFEEILDPRFLRVHKSFIVNLKQVKQTRGIFDRSYEIEFYDYEPKALMSRYKYPEYKKRQGL